MLSLPSFSARTDIGTIIVVARSIILAETKFFALVSVFKNKCKAMKYKRHFQFINALGSLKRTLS